jgi:hypothetical protein
MNAHYTITVASPPDRELVVAEIFFADIQWAEIHQELENLNVEFYPRPDGRPWSLSLDLVIAALGEARERLRR